LPSFTGFVACVAYSLLKMNAGYETDFHENVRVASSSCKLQGLSSALKPVRDRGRVVRNFFL
jgi:hypothetical protein